MDEKYFVAKIQYELPDDNTGKKSRQWTWFDKHSWEKSDRYFKADADLLRSNLKE